MARKVNIEQFEEEQTLNNIMALSAPQESSTATSIQPSCQQKTNVTQQAIDQQTDVTPQSKEAKLLFLPVKLSDKLVNAFIDTGASVNFIRAEAVPKGTRYMLVNEDLVDAHGSRCAIKHACHLDTEINGKKYKLQFFVCRDAHTMMTLGIDWMEEYKVILDIASATITFDEKTHKLTRMTCTGVFFTYYGQPNLELWFPKRPAFFNAYLDKISAEIKIIDENEYSILKASLETSGQGLLYKQGLLLAYEANKRPRLYVPKKLRARIFNRFHIAPNEKHFSAAITWYSISEHYYWPGMQNEIYDSLRKCAVCIERANQPNNALMQKPDNSDDRMMCKVIVGDGTIKYDANGNAESLSSSDAPLDLIETENCIMQLAETSSYALKSTDVEEPMIDEKKDLSK